MFIIVRLAPSGQRELKLLPTLSSGKKKEGIYESPRSTFAIKATGANRKKNHATDFRLDQSVRIEPYLCKVGIQFHV
jgi:hypothetical protein